MTNPTISSIDIHNPSDHSWNDRVFCLHFGAYGSVAVLVWAQSADQAFELAVDWCDDHGLSGVFELIEDEADEIDMTIVSHTQLQCVDGPAGIPSWEWTIDDITGEDLDLVKARSVELCKEDEEPDSVDGPGLAKIELAELPVSQAI